MRHLLKYPKMLLMDYLLTKKLSPKCCFDMSYQEQSLLRDCSYQHISIQLDKLLPVFLYHENRHYELSYLRFSSFL